MERQGLNIRKQSVYTLSFVMLTLSRILFDSTHLGDLVGEAAVSAISLALLVGALGLLGFLALFYEYPKQGIVVTVACAGIFAMSCFKCRATNLFICAIYLYFADMIRDKRKFARIVIALFASILLVVSLLAASGLIGMSVVQRATSESMRYSMGFTHPNQIGILSFGIIAMLFYHDSGKTQYEKYVKYVVSVILTMATFLVTNTFSFLALSMLLMMGSFAYDTLLCRLMFSQKDARRFVRIGLTLMALLVAFVVYRLWKNPYLLQGGLKTLRTRFLLGQRYIKAYGIRLFGNKIIVGDDVEIPGFSRGYFYLDNGYIRLLVESGVLATLVVMLGLFRTVVNLIRASKWQYLIIVLCLLVYLFNEQKMITIFFNPMWLLMREYMLPDRRRDPSALLARYIHALRQQNPERNKGGEWR